MTLSEAASRVIDLAGKVRTYYDTELPKRHPRYPLVGSGEEKTPPPPEQDELKRFLLSLPDDLLFRLMALMYLGRGDFLPDDLGEYCDSLKGAFAPESAAAQMMGKAPLADYLSDGLDELRKHHIQVDKIPTKKIKVRKR